MFPLHIFRKYYILKAPNLKYFFVRCKDLSPEIKESHPLLKYFLPIRAVWILGELLET